MSLPCSLQLKTLQVQPPLVLAPMSGLSHTALRQLVGELGGCGLFYTEMLSARALAAERPESSLWLRRSPSEGPLVYQLLATAPEEIVPALDKLQACGADALDLNMGCTAALIIKRGGGIALMKDLRRAEAIVKTARLASDLPLTVKIRLGWSLDWRALRQFCLMLQDSGADAVVIHPRLKQDRLKRPARWDYIARIKELLDVPVIGNGDVDSPQAALRMFNQTGCDAVMIGRAAVKRPWLFRQVAGCLAGLPEVPAPAEPSRLYLRFASLLSAAAGPRCTLPLLKQFTYYFSQNYAFGHSLWRTVYNAASLEEATARASAFFKTQRPKPDGFVKSLS